MATWKRILVEGDVTGTGVISVSATAPHIVSLGDPENTTSDIGTPAADDKLLIWDQSAQAWLYVLASEFTTDTHLGNTNLVQTTSTRTFDVAANGVLEFHLNSSTATGETVTKVKMLSSTPSIPEFGGTLLEVAALELNTPDNTRQSRAIIISVDEANVGAFNSSAFAGAYGFDTSTATYESAVSGGIIRLEGWSEVGALTDDTEGSETYIWDTDKLRYAAITLGSSGFVTPATFWDEPSTSAVTAQQDFGGTIDFEIQVPQEATPFYAAKTKLRIDNVGVRINDELNDQDSYYLPKDKGTEGYVMTTDGVSAAKWSNPLEIFLPELMTWVNENSGGTTIYGTGVLNGDFNGDGAVTAADLITFLSAYGSTVADYPPMYSYSNFAVGASDITTAANYNTNTLNAQLLNVDDSGTALNYTPHLIAISESADYIAFKEENGNPYGAAFNNYKVKINSLNVDITKTAAVQDVVNLTFKLQAVYDDNGSDVVADLSNLMSPSIWSNYDSNMHHIGIISLNSAGTTSHVISETIEPMLQLSNYASVPYGAPKEVRIKFYAFREFQAQGEITVEITGLSVRFIP